MRSAASLDGMGRFLLTLDRSTIAGSFEDLMKIRLLGFPVFSFILLVAVAGQSAWAGQAPVKVTMTTGSFSEREAAMYVAQDQGFFRRYGLELTFVQVRNGPIGMTALAAGESQFHEGSVTGAVLGSAAEGTDLVFVAGMINKLIGNVMASPKIKSPSDLKGKVIAVTSPSGGSWMFTTLALEYWGLDAKRDGITFRILGDESVRSQALLNDTVAATHLGYTFAAPLKSRGFTNLADLAQLPIPFQSTGVLTKRSFINSSPEIVESVLRGIVDSMAFIAQPENKAAVLKSLAKGLRLPNVEQAVEGYESLPMLYDRRIYPRVDGVRNVIRLLGATNEKIRRLKAEDLVDDRFVKKLEKEGRFQ
jgi:NitT/TauT family transport system substrate-binding protein